MMLGVVAASATAFAANERNWRRRAHAPPLPYPQALHPGRNAGALRLHIRPNARSPALPYPGALRPEAPILLPQGFTMTVEREAGKTASASERRSILRAPDIAEGLADCWSPDVPPAGETYEASIRLGFRRNGEVIGLPAVTYLKAGTLEGGRAALRASILSAIAACAPLRFTPELGSAIAGRPFAIRFVARRAQPVDPLVP